MNHTKEILLFMKDFLPKLASGKVKILSWGNWRGAVDGTFRIMIDWKVEE